MYNNWLSVMHIERFINDRESWLIDLKDVRRKGLK